VPVAALPTLQFKISYHLASANDDLAGDGLFMIRKNVEGTDTEGRIGSVLKPTQWKAGLQPS
jgi:hypothetical protein